MSQRNPLNDRYQNDNRGKTRKSSASAKPKADRAATLRDPAPKSKKQKKQERRQREQEAQRKTEAIGVRFEDTPGYKRLRRYWWVCLICAIAVTAASVFINAQSSTFFGENPDGRFLGLFDRNATGVASTVFMVSAYVFIIAAFWLDLGKIRKERKIYNASVVNDNSKAARKQQKKALAEQRALEKEAAEKYEQAKAEEAAKKQERRGPLAWLRRGKSEAAEAKEHLAEKAEAEKERLGK